MNTRHPVILAAQLIFLSQFLFINTQLAQNCIEYPEIEGPFCTNCTPEGWSIESSSPDLADPSAYPCSPPESPSGGNVIHLFSNGSNDIEAVSSNFTIPDFTAGEEYYFGMYVMACGPHPVEILITINGDDYAIDSEEEWQYVELCLTPESEDVSIFITVEDYTSGSVTNTLLDTGICDDEFCCTLRAELEEELIELCPGEELDIEGMYSGETGSVDIEWSSDPDYGVDYLDDPESINPTLIIPEDFDFDGETIIYTVSVEDSECQIFREFELEIKTSKTPEFEIFLCELYSDYELPLVSLDDYTGIWTGDFDFEDLAGETHEYTFTLDPGQDNCVQSWTYEFFIHPEELVSFEYNTVYCVDDDETYYLPEKSTERIEGEWDEDKFTPDELGIGVHSYTFFPEQTEYCADEYELLIEVIGGQIPGFDLPQSFCAQADSFLLPKISNEGISGEWDSDFIDLNIETESSTLVFRSSEINCSAEYEYSYAVLGELSVSFNHSDTICRNALPFTPDSLSNELFTGYWTPESVSPDTVTGQWIIMEWTPLDNQSDCLTSQIDSIYINEIAIPEFILPNSLCTNSGVLDLPLVSNNAIHGTWNIPSIDTDMEPAGTINLEFKPLDPECTECFYHSLELVDSEMFEVEFSLPTVLCAGDEALVLPNESLNQVTGTWTQEIINPAEIQDSIVLIFTPDNNFTSCYSETQFVIYVEEKTNPEFSLPEYLCSSGDIYEFPVISNNEIPGHWTIAQFNPDSQSHQAILQNSFIPDDLSCYNELSIETDILEFTDIELIISDASSCTTLNGAVEIIAPGNNVEVSFNDGINWNAEYEYSDLAPGIYNITLRYLNTDCRENFEFEIAAPSAVKIIELSIDSIIGCDDSSADITCLANNNDTEFSIDDGLNWQTNGEYENLLPGDYTLIVRSNESEDCRDTSYFNITGFEETVISNIEITELSDCEEQDAAIDIQATGQSLEYSIDGGQNWYSNNVFENLAGGTYDVHVRSTLAEDCLDTQSVEITNLEAPVIEDIFASDLTACSENNGSIEILATGSGLEYSVDDGVNWQSDSTFQNLEAGTYEIIIRYEDNKNCFDSQTIILSAPGIPVINSIDVMNISSCNEDNGMLEVDVIGDNLEYSIDGGLDWTSDSLVSGLAAGDYMLIVRDSEHPDCTDSINFQIEAVEEIEILDVIYTQPVSCIGSDAHIELIVNQEDLEFSIDNMQTWQDDGLFTMLPEASYTIVIRSTLNPDCILLYEFEVSNPPCPCNLLEIEFSTTDVDCLNPDSGSITIENVEGMVYEEDFILSWENGSTALNIDGLFEGWHSFTISYDKNCLWEDSIYIDSYDPIGFDLLSFDQDCAELGSIEVINFMGGSGQPLFSIDGINFQENSVFTSLTAQEYQIIVEDLFNCAGSESTVINDASDLQVDIPGIDAIELGESTTLNPLINQTTIDSFNWYPLEGILNPGELIAEVAPAETSIYTLTIYFGTCIETRSVTVEVLPGPDIYLGNIFDPQGFGTNDRFIVQSHADTKISIDAFRIFDRWGNLVFENENFLPNEISEAWDGRYNNEFVNPGVYVYTLEFRYKESKRQLAGTVTVIGR